MHTLPNAPYLGPRLRSLLRLIADRQQQQRYDVIWDCCCDHGYLGINILHRELAPQVVLVDQIASIMALLEPRLSSYPADQYRLITGDVGELEFCSDKRHLVIIAGVGGENIVKMLEAIALNHSNVPIDFLFCPATTQYDLREYLAAQNYSLLHESLVTEKGRDYEVIYVQHSHNADILNPISLAGDMWDTRRPEHLRYLKKLVAHYRNQSRTDDSGRKRQAMLEYQRCLGATGEEIAL